MSEPSPRPLDEPHADRLALDRPDRQQVLDAHRAALAAGTDSYLDPGTGRLVLTARFLRDRGECCNAGCRHCPYLV